MGGIKGRRKTTLCCVIQNLIGDLMNQEREGVGFLLLLCVCVLESGGRECEVGNGSG